MWFGKKKKEHKAIVEMPKGTRYKYEVEKITGMLVLDRPIDAPVPFNYGCIPGPLCADNDLLDVFIISVEPIPPLTLVDIEPIGLIEGFDDKKQDDKVLAFVKDDTHSKSVISKEEATNAVVNYLKTYKKGFEVGETFDQNKALLEIERARNYFTAMKSALSNK
jgi:inorganic pyrophosphatase